jgi:F-type H+-transporting ATPase subunit b
MLVLSVLSPLSSILISSLKHKMDTVLRQLGELLLGSIPTAAFLLLVFGAYTSLVHKPLVRVLAERRRQTVGAMEKARADIAATEARTAEYEQRLREGRLAVFKSQEERRQRALQARSAAVAEARRRAQAQVEQARADIERDKGTAKATLQAQTEEMAAEIIRVVLRPVRTASPAGGQ